MRRDSMGRRCHGNGAPGETNGRARLTWRDVEMIRGADRILSLGQCAIKYGVGRSTIEAVRKETTWKRQSSSSNS